MGGEIESQSVFRKEYGADAKLAGDSPGAGAGFVSNEHGCRGLGFSAKHSGRIFELLFWLV